MNEVIEGYNIKIKREKDLILYNAKSLRKAAYINILPHIKPNSLTETNFNVNIWPIDEERVKDDKNRMADKQRFVQEHNRRLSEARRLKAQQKN